MGEDLAHAVDAVDPHRFELVEEVAHPANGVDVGPDELFASLPSLGHEACPFQLRHVLLHRREAHRVFPGQLRHRVLPRHTATEDVASGGVGHRTEPPVAVRLGAATYNHWVVRYGTAGAPSTDCDTVQRAGETTRPSTTAAPSVAACG